MVRLFIGQEFGDGIANCHGYAVQPKTAAKQMVHDVDGDEEALVDQFDEDRAIAGFEIGDEVGHEVRKPRHV